MLINASYYDTLAHETIHWTNHPERLQRQFTQKIRGKEGYAMEELVAELGASFLAADLGIENDPARIMPPTSAAGSRR